MKLGRQRMMVTRMIQQYNKAPRGDRKKKESLETVTFGYFWICGNWFLGHFENLEFSANMSIFKFNFGIADFSINSDIFPLFWTTVFNNPDKETDVIWNTI